MTDPTQGRFTGNIEARWAGLGPYALEPAQLDQLGSILDLLERDDSAPTTVREPDAAVERHLADALSALEVQELGAEGCAIADLGAGAGFPGAVLAVALPSAHVSLVESQRRKCEFLVRLLTGARIGNANVVCARAEEWEEGRLANDVVVARALAPQPVVLEYAAPLLRPGGMLIDWRGRRDDGDERAAALAGRALGLELREIREVRPFPSATDRHLHVWRKTGETPGRFPRRAGMARKRPLGS
ncbi:MAG TPA: RsmG family class I SAM-dependent methyltransferase [Solirubrobacteraceae bacterium]|nr:RsmG family class I SAM-dependent methyltransferase [Solirubrobacteraceae bacterium]